MTISIILQISKLTFSLCSINFFHSHHFLSQTLLLTLCTLTITVLHWLDSAFSTDKMKIKWYNCLLVSSSYYCINIRTTFFFIHLFCHEWYIHSLMKSALSVQNCFYHVKTGYWHIYLITMFHELKVAPIHEVSLQDFWHVEDAPKHFSRFSDLKIWLHKLYKSRPLTSSSH